MNITFEVIIDKNIKPVTFYNIDAITSKGNNALIISGGKEWVASISYGELWDKIKKHLDESAT